MRDPVAQWTVRAPGRAERDRVFETEGPAAVSAAMHAGKVQPAVIVYPNGVQYIVFHYDPTVEYTTKAPGDNVRHVVEI